MRHHFESKLKIITGVLLLVLQFACDPMSKKTTPEKSNGQSALPDAGLDIDLINPGEVRTLDADRARVHFVETSLNQSVNATALVNKEELTHTPADERGNVTLAMYTENGSLATTASLNENLKIVIKAYQIVNDPGLRVLVLDDQFFITDEIPREDLTVDTNVNNVLEVSFETFYTNATFVLIDPPALDPTFYVNADELEALIEVQGVEDISEVTIEGLRYTNESKVVVDMVAKKSTYSEFQFGEGDDCSEFAVQTQKVAQFQYQLSPSEGLKTLCLKMKNTWEDEAQSTQDIFYDQYAPNSTFTIASAMGPEMQEGPNTSLGGTAEDTEAGSGIDKVLFTLQDSNGLCLNAEFNSFDQECPLWLASSGTTEWAAVIADDVFVHNQSYTMQAKALDKSGLEQEEPGSQSFTWDASAPQSVFVINNNDNITNSRTVTLTMIDDTDVDQYRVADGDDCSAAEWIDYTPPSISFEMAEGDGEKTVCLQTRDQVFNKSIVALDDIILDTELPVSGASILSDLGPMSTEDFANAMTFTGTASDSGSGLSDVYISIRFTGDGSCLNATFSNFGATCPNWIRVDGDMENWTTEGNILDARFYAPGGTPAIPNNALFVFSSKAVDVAGNEQSPVFTANFAWRENGPDASLSLDNGKQYTNDTTVSVDPANTSNYSEFRKQEVSDCANVTWTDGDWLPWTGSLDHNIAGGDGNIRVCFQVKDDIGGGNLSSIAFDDITLDTTEPDSTVSTTGTLGPNSTAATDTTLSGTSTDAMSGVDEVYISIQEGAGNCLDAGKTGFSAACPVWHLTSGTTSWSINIADALFTDGNTYNVSSKAVDNATNEETTFGTNSFDWDETAPNAQFVINTDDTYTTSLTVNLDLTDDTDVSLYIADENGATPNANIAYTNGGGNQIVNYNLTNGDGVKTVTLKVADDVGNESTHTDTITLDTTEPESAITTSGALGVDTNGTATTTVIEGTATDATSGLNEVYISIKYDDNPLFCLNSTKDAFDAACPNWFIVNGTATWNVTLTDTFWSNGSYEITSKAVDLATNQETTNPKSTFIWFGTPPDANFSINNGDNFTNDANVTLDLNNDTGITHYEAEEGACTAAPATSYGGGGSIAFVLSGGDGAKTVCLKVKDGANNESTVITDDITLDTTRPTSTLTTSGNFGPNSYAGVDMQFVGTATDATSGLDKVQVSVQRDSNSMYLNIGKTAFDSATVVWHDAAGTSSWALTIADSLFTGLEEDFNIQVKAIDNAGNEQSPLTTGTLTWDETAPDATFVINNDDPGVNVTGVNLNITDPTDYYQYLAEEGNCSGTSYASYVSNPIAFTLSGTQATKTVCLKVRDSAGNVSAIVSDSIDYDATVPVSIVTDISSGGNIGPTTTAGGNTDFVGTASDNLSGLNSVEVSIQEGAGNCLSAIAGTFSVVCPNWLSATGTDTWTLSVSDGLFSDNTSYTVKSRATDEATNVQGTFGQQTFTWQSSAPSAAFTINNNDPGTNSTAVTLDLSDDTDIYEYFAEEGACGSPSYTTYAGGGSINFTLSGGEGSKTVCLIVRDASGNTSGIISDSIFYDTTDPTAAISTGTTIDAATTGGGNTDFTGTASDGAGSGLNVVELQIQRHSDGQCLNSGATAFNATCPQYISATGTTSWTLTVADSIFDQGQYEVTVRASDDATNSVSVSQTHFWQVGTEARFIDIAVGEKHACALSGDGDIYCWGQNTNGQLGVDTTTEVAINDYAYAPQYAVNVPASETFTAITAGAHHTCALSSEGKAYCWGSNSDGQIGNSTVSQPGNQETAIEIESGAAASNLFRQIAASGNHTCGLHDDGYTYCWGAGTDGQIGDGNTTAVNTTPVQTTNPGGNSFFNIGAGYYHNCGIAENSRTAYCWGEDDDGEIGDGTPDDGNNILESPSAVDMSSYPNEKAVKIAGVEDATCMLTASGKVLCFGNDTQGGVGDGAGDSSPVKSPTQVSGSVRFIDLAAGMDHFCAIASTGKLFCWGDNVDLQAGDGGGSDVFAPREVDTQTGLLFKKLAAGGQTTCAINDAGSVYCFGNDTYGQQGNGGTADADSAAPVAVDASSLSAAKLFVKVSSGVSHQCALSVSGDIYCWGKDDYGQLGNGSVLTASQTKPGLVESNVSGSGSSLVKFKDVVAGGNHTCGLAADGLAYCWGDNQYGQLGNGTSGAGNKSEAPVAVGLGMPFKTLALGLYHTCGIRANNTSETFCWGKGDNGAIGDNGSANRSSPTIVSGSHVFTDIAAGNDFSCGIKSNLDTYCWGSDYYGTLGDDGTDSSNALPTSTVNTASSGYISIASQNNHVCAVTTAFDMECWGQNNRGQLGDGTTSIAQTPTVVSYAVTGVQHIALGTEHSCLTATNGRLLCFGADDKYISNGVESGDQTTPYDFYSVDLNVKDSKWTAAGSRNSCYLQSNGIVKCIGIDADGQKGDGATSAESQFNSVNLDVIYWY